MELQELLNKVSDVTYTQYELTIDENQIIDTLSVSLEELLNEYKHLEETFIEYDKKVNDDYEIKKSKRWEYE